LNIAGSRGVPPSVNFSSSGGRWHAAACHRLTPRYGTGTSPKVPPDPLQWSVQPLRGEAVPVASELGSLGVACAAGDRFVSRHGVGTCRDPKLGEGEFSSQLIGDAVKREPRSCNRSWCPESQADAPLFRLSRKMRRQVRNNRHERLLSRLPPVRLHRPHHRPPLRRHLPPPRGRSRSRFLVLRNPARRSTRAPRWIPHRTGRRASPPRNSSAKHRNPLPMQGSLSAPGSTPGSRRCPSESGPRPPPRMPRT